MPLGEFLFEVGFRVVGEVLFAGAFDGRKQANNLDSSTAQELRERFAAEAARVPGSIFLGLIDGKSVGVFRDGEGMYRLHTIYLPGKRDKRWHAYTKALDSTAAKALIMKYGLAPMDPLRLHLPK
ncbi:hypothetical protein IP84_02190 [beta proteobacterium AAP99]|nr:hypothetical protein IP84_02190 [beta proteobacterium AAP99]